MEAISPGWERSDRTLTIRPCFATSPRIAKERHLFCPECAASKMMPMSAGSSSAQSVKLTGFRLRAARLLWIGMAGFTIFLFIAGIQPSFEIGLRLLPESQEALRAAGFSLQLPAYVLVITDSLTVLFFGVIAFLLVWRRGDELMTLVVASMLLFTGALYTG